MSLPEDGTEPVDCAEIVYRALKKKWIQGEQIQPEAFIRRIRGDEAENAVSISRRKYVTARECREKLNRMPSSSSLHAGRVRDLPHDLDIFPEPDRNEHDEIIDPGHCLLVNLPDPIVDYEEAEVVASQLIKVARHVTPDQEEEEHLRRRTGGPDCWS